jgi:hypothetical protein
MLAEFSKDAEFTVQPFDSRFEAVVTVYATENKDQRKCFKKLNINIKYDNWEG